MKKYLMLLASFMMLGSFVSCSENEKPEPEPEPEVEQSKDCKILTFDLKSGDVEIKGDVYEQDKVVECIYLPEQADLIKNMDATCTISDKATISPDPTTVKDYSIEQKFTVTAEDGKAKTEYTVIAKAAKFDVSIKPGNAIELQSVLEGSPIKVDGNVIAFCSPSMLALPSMEAISFDGSKKEKINVDGIPTGYCIQGMGNDDNGYLVVCFGYGDGNYGGKTPEFLAEIQSMQVWIWKDGYQKAPTKIYENAGAVGGYFTVGGDFNKSMICSGKSYANRAGTNHLWMWENGKPEVVKGAWQWVIGDPRESFKAIGADNPKKEGPYWWNGCGNTPGEMVNFIDGTKEGKVLWSCAFDKSFFDQDKGKEVSAGGAVFVRDGAGDGKTEGYAVEEKNMHLNANTFEQNLVAAKRHAGQWGYGNIAATPQIKGFKYSGEHYAAVTSTGWQAAYMTIINISKSNKEKTAYLLDTQKADCISGTPAHGSAAFVYDPETQTGHVAFLQHKVAGGVASNEGKIYFYEIVRKKL